MDGYSNSNDRWNAFLSLSRLNVVKWYSTLLYSYPLNPLDDYLSVYAKNR